MKKIFKVFALLVGLMLVAAPSYALVGVDDAVPGHNIIVPFIVEIAPGLDTNVVIQDISDAAILGATEATAAGQIHWTMYSRSSVHLKDQDLWYSGGDVVPITVRGLIDTWCNAADRAALAYDLNGDGTNDHYVGYLYFENRVNTALVQNNLVAFFQYVDLDAGIATGTYAAMKEFLDANGAVTVVGGNSIPNNYHYEQLAHANAVGPGTEPATFLAAANTTATNFEVFSPAAYFWSYFRERGQTDAAINLLAPRLNFMRFTPRFYIHNSNGESFVLLWKNRNHAAPLNNRIEIFIWDPHELRVSGWLTLPNELNILRVRDIIPSAWLATYPVAGWLDIMIAGDAGVIPAGFDPAGYLENWRYTEFLLWTWMYAHDASAALNWSNLWNDRQVGTSGGPPRPGTPTTYQPLK